MPVDKKAEAQNNGSPPAGNYAEIEQRIAQLEESWGSRIELLEEQLAAIASAAEEATSTNSGPRPFKVAPGRFVTLTFGTTAVKVAMIVGLPIEGDIYHVNVLAYDDRGFTSQLGMVPHWSIADETTWPVWVDPQGGEPC